MGQFKAVLFDLDGTLLDTLDDLADSMNRVLARMKFPVHPTNAYKYFVGDGMDELARRVLPETARDSSTIQNCIADMKQDYGAHWADNSKPYDGIPEMLDALREQGMRLVVLSNKPDNFTRATVEHFFPENMFELVAGARPEIKKKPDPAGAIIIADKIGLNPQQFLYLGDTATDMKTAVQAGMFPLGALWGFRTAEELQDSGAESLLKTPDEILNYIG
jgi:phosphoglycolate phosphatase